MSIAQQVEIKGSVSAGFDAVRDAFEENFVRRRELGGACCIFHRGEKVVDLWGGVRNRATQEPWEHDTMVLVYSATKGLSAMTLALAHSRGWLDYEAPVCSYWPEFAQNGKDKITVRQLLSHQAGLYAFDEPVDIHVVADLDSLATVLARQKPAWEPGARQAYHEFMKADAQFSLGFMKSNPGWAFGSALSYGSPGAGGSLGYADPQTGIAYAYVTNRKGTHLEGDPRNIALRKALDTIVPTEARV